jgi:hypothetical protein
VGLVAVSLGDESPRGSARNRAKSNAPAPGFLDRGAARGSLTNSRRSDQWRDFDFETSARDGRQPGGMAAVVAVPDGSHQTAVFKTRAEGSEMSDSRPKIVHPRVRNMPIHRGGPVPGADCVIVGGKRTR